MLARRSLTLVGVCIVLLALPNIARGQGKTDGKIADQKFLDDVRNAYSMLRRQGLTEINATVLPNWQSIFAALPAAQRPEAMKLASQLRFTMFADANGKVRVTHRVVGPKFSKLQSNAAKTIASGVELSVTGFLMSWVPFMMTHLIPDKLDKYVLQDMNTDHLLTFNEGGIDISVKIGKDFVISELTTSQGSVKPLLMRSSKGFVLTGYEGTNEDPVAGRVLLKASIESALVAGMQVPKSVSLDGSASGTPFNLKFNFTNYRLKTNPAVEKK